MDEAKKMDVVGHVRGDFRITTINVENVTKK